MTICLIPKIAYLFDSGEEHMANDHLKSTGEYSAKTLQFPKPPTTRPLLL